MLDGENIVVDHLVKIIQALQIGRATGSLIATRGNGNSYESGNLVFLNGRVVHAKIGRREGQEAFNTLSTWGKCRYTFVLSITSERTTGSLQPLHMQKEVKAPQREPEQVDETVPYRSKPLQYGLQVVSKKSLSQMHRNVFLLVDGVRRVSDLMRLLKLNENEVLALLYDLQDTGVISLPVPLAL